MFWVAIPCCSWINSSCWGNIWRLFKVNTFSGQYRIQRRALIALRLVSEQVRHPPSPLSSCFLSDPGVWVRLLLDLSFHSVFSNSLGSLCNLFKAAPSPAEVLLYLSACFGSLLWDQAVSGDGSLHPEPPGSWTVSTETMPACSLAPG